jgi:hypothetical protein
MPLLNDHWSRTTPADLALFDDTFFLSWRTAIGAQYLFILSNAVPTYVCHPGLFLQMLKYSNQRTQAGKFTLLAEF